jgi:adenylate cyclase
LFIELDMLLASAVSDSAVKPPVLELHDGERRIVSILFADVRGFTRMSEKLDPEQVRMVIDKLLQLFTICIKNYGGYVDKYEGDQVMALFGAKRASEMDTERCLRAALDMLEKLCLFNGILADKPAMENMQLDIRVGVNTGLVTTGRVGEKREGDFTVYGDAVNLASRMEENAPLNSIMVPREVSDIAREHFEFDSNGTISVKGRSEPVEVFLVRGIRKRDSLMRENWQFRFTGRTRELETLTGKFRSLSGKIAESCDQDIRPEVAAIRGAAGLGKTRLVSEFISCIEEESVRNSVLHASVPAFAQTPYCLFTDLIGGYMGVRKTDPVRELKQRLEDTVENLSQEIPASCSEYLVDALPIIGYLFGLDYEDPRLRLDPKVLRDHVLLSIRHFIESIALNANRRGYPLLIVLEDLHWVDEASKAVIDFLLKTLNLENRREGGETAGIMFIVTYRPEFELAESWGSFGSLARLDLEPLSDAECEGLLGEHLCDIGLTLDRKRELLRKSEGNPFYLQEWVKLLSSPDLKRADIRILPVPDTLTALILSRIDRLDEDVRLLLQKASVNGMEFSSEVLRYIEAKLNRSRDIDGQLAGLVESGFVNFSGENIYSFSHAITRDVSYNTLLIANRKILHRLIGEFTEEKYPGRLSEMYPVLAHHFMQADETDRAIRYLTSAVEEAEEKFDHGSAIDFYDSLCSIYENLLEASTGDDRTKYTHELGRWLAGKGKLLEPIGKWDESRQIYERALELSVSINDATRAARMRTNLSVIHWRKGDVEEARRMLEECLTELRESGDGEGLAMALLNSGNIHLHMGSYDEAIECYRKVVDYYLTVDHGDQRVALYTGNMGIAYMYKLMHHEAEECFRQQLEICGNLGDRHGIATVINNLGELYRMMGDLDRAMEHFNRAYRAFEETGDVNRCGCALGNIAIIQYTRGDFRNAVDNYREAIDILKAVGNRYHAALYSGNLAIAYLHMDKRREAAAWFDTAISESESMKCDHLLQYWLFYQAENFLGTGDLELAADSIRRSETIAGKLDNQSHSTRCRILSLRIRFEMLEDDSARELESIEPLREMFEESEDIHDRVHIGYALTGMYGRISQDELHERFRQATIELAREICETEEDFQWRHILQELEG